MSAAGEALRFTGLFESELLVELMLRYWKHPCADDASFRNDLLESAAEVLRASVAGQQVIAEMPPEHMNLVAAVWYAESCALAPEAEISADERRHREQWLDAVLRAVPSCFCHPDRLT